MEQLTLYDICEPPKNPKNPQCEKCKNYKVDGDYEFCGCLIFNEVGITRPEQFPNGCKWFNAEVIRTSRNCNQNINITEENKNKCIGCVEDCFMVGYGAYEVGDLFKDTHNGLYIIAEIKKPTYGNNGFVYGVKYKDIHNTRFSKDIALWMKAYQFKEWTKID